MARAPTTCPSRASSVSYTPNRLHLAPHRLKHDFGAATQVIHCIPHVLRHIRSRRDETLNRNSNPQLTADQSGRSVYGMNQHSVSQVPASNEEGAGLIAHAADPSRATSPFRAYDEEPYESDLGYRGAATRFQTGPLSAEPQSMSYQQQTHGYLPPSQQQRQQDRPYHAMSADEDDYVQVPEPRVNRTVMEGRDEGPGYSAYDQATMGGSQSEARPPPNDMQRQIGAALWGSNPHQHPGGPMI